MGGSASSTVHRKVNVEQIKKEVKEAPVVMYSKQSCGYCTMAKDLLNGERIAYKERSLDGMKRSLTDADYQSYVNGLVYITRQTTVPQIFICGEFIGGYVQLNALKEENKLRNKLDVCTNDFVI